MPERTPSEHLWADLERQLLALPHEHLAKVCAHLIRTYIIENRATPRPISTTPAAPATPVRDASASSPPMQTPTRTSRQPETAQAPTQPAEPTHPKESSDKKYNKLEMD